MAGKTCAVLPGGSVGRATYSAAATSHGARRRGTDSSAWRYGDGSREIEVDVTAQRG